MITKEPISHDDVDAVITGTQINHSKSGGKIIIT